MWEIQNNMKFKNNNIEEPYLYLGAILKKKELNSRKIWRWPAEVIKIAWIPTNENLADDMMNISTAEKMGTLFGQWTY